VRSVRLAAHYGFGAAQLALPASPHVAVSVADGSRAALRELASAGGLLALLRGGAFGAVALGLMVLLARSVEPPAEREMVWLETPPEVLAEVAALAPPLPEPLPPPMVAPPERAEPPPQPEPPAARTIEPQREWIEPTAPAPVIRRPVRPVVAPEPLRSPELPRELASSSRVARRPETPLATRSFAHLTPPVVAGAASTALPELASRSRRSAPTRGSPSATASRPPAIEAPSFAQASAVPTSRAPSSARGLPPPAPPPASAGPGGAATPRLRGVSLAAFAACLSDREEDSLRQRVVAAVPRPEQCTSEAGTWRFVETKNVNAFLLWVERSPARRAGDRCEELSLALDCLARGVRRELQEG
jgi:hypothetical protein